MASLIIMPKQGQSVESCIITQWMKKEGDTVREGDTLFSYETDKAAFEEEAKAGGILLKLLAKEGDDVPCLSGVCIIGEAGEDVSALLSQDAPSETASVSETVEKTAPVPVTIRIENTASGAAISPRARNAAEKLGVDASMATATGAEGRIMERDILALSQNATRSVGGSDTSGTGLGGRKTLADSQKPQPEEVSAPVQDAGYTERPLSNIRKTIAKAMMNSLQNTAQLTHTLSFDATEIFALRAKFKASADASISGITIGDMVLFAVTRVLPAFEALNAHLTGDTLRIFSGVNLGVAVDTPRGLMVPTVFGAERLSLAELSKRVKELAASAKEGSINPDLLQGGSFTVSNLGGFGVEHFTPILNYPQTGILGVCAAVDAVRMGKNGIEIYKSMPLCLTYDHRAIDGAPATLFLAELKKTLENFTALMAK